MDSKIINIRNAKLTKSFLLTGLLEKNLTSQFLKQWNIFGFYFKLNFSGK